MDMNDAPARRDGWVPLRWQDIPQEKAKSIEAVIGELPDIPLSVGRIIDMTSTETHSLKEVVEVISSDPALVSGILRVVNSSYYGLSHKTDNLYLAVVLLGFREVKKLVLRTFMMRSVVHGSGVNVRDLWEHAYLVSVLAEQFAPEDDQQERGVLLTVGLLHDIGKFSLSQIAQQMKQENARPLSASPAPAADYLMAGEEHLFGVNHPMIGGLLAKKWNLSERFITILSHHHHPQFFPLSDAPSPYRREIAAVCLADLIVNRFLGVQPTLPEPAPDVFAEVGVEPSIDRLLETGWRERLAAAQAFLVKLT